MFLTRMIGAIIPALLLCLCCGCPAAALKPDFIRPTATSAPSSKQPCTINLSHLRQPWYGHEPIPWGTIFTLGKISEAAYLAPEPANATLKSFGFQSVDFFSSGATFGCVASNGDVVVIAYRGTDDVQDWLANLDARQEQVPHGRIHRGFHTAMLRDYERIVQLAAAHKAQDKQVWVTGHSLGGGLAVAFVCELCSRKSLHVDGLVTFGQPLLMDHDLAEFLHQQIGGAYVRVINNRDLVPRVPPNYDHGGTLIHFANGRMNFAAWRKVTSSVERLLVAAADIEEIRAALQPMAEQEFKSLQDQLRRNSALDVVASTDDGRRVREKPDWLVDHQMKSYLDAITAYSGRLTEPLATR